MFNHIDIIIVWSKYIMTLREKTVYTAMELFMWDIRIT
jgi:hypothetical protein